MARSTAAGLVACAAAALCAIALAEGTARAYPSTIVFAPTGEALGFGGFVIGAYGGMVVNPQPVSFGAGWGGINVGFLPSFDLVTTPAGKIAFAGAELGVDAYGPDEDGDPTLVLNAKIQLLKEATYWPAVAVGFFQFSPEITRGAALGFFALSKSFTIAGVELGQLTFGMMRSFAGDDRVAPRCITSSAGWCVFRGSIPFEDDNGGLFGGYVSPWLGPVSLSVDHVGGTSAVSSTNVAVNVRFWQDGAGGYALAGAGGFFSHDRREGPTSPGIEDGLFVQVGLVSSLRGLFGWDPLAGPPPDPNRPKKRDPASAEDPFDAPPITPPVPR